jgi:hypothetical protein
MPRQVAVCAKCINIREIEKHHIFPKRFFSGRNNQSKINLCASCHREIESLLPYYFKFSKGQYIEIHRAWIRGMQPAVIIRREKGK